MYLNISYLEDDNIETSNSAANLLEDVLLCTLETQSDAKGKGTDPELFLRGENQ